FFLIPSPPLAAPLFPYTTLFRSHIARPVGAELERHGDAADYADRERQREYLDPEPVGVHPFGIAGFIEPQLEEQQRPAQRNADRSEEHTSELQSLRHIVCRLLLD